jgi:hypothetical protein
LLKKYDKCFNCLNTGHRVQDCRTKHNCFYCKAVRKQGEPLPTQGDNRRLPKLTVSPLRSFGVGNVPRRHTGMCAVITSRSARKAGAGKLFTDARRHLRV